MVVRFTYFDDEAKIHLSVLHFFRPKEVEYFLDKFTKEMMINEAFEFVL